MNLLVNYMLAFTLLLHYWVYEIEEADWFSFSDLNVEMS